MSDRFDREYRARFMWFETIIVIMVISCFLAFAQWARTTELDEVTVATGQVRHRHKVHTVQYHDSGRVAKLYVKEGDQIKRGQLLLTLKDEATTHDLRVAKLRLQALYASKNEVASQHSWHENIISRGFDTRASLFGTANKLNEISSAILEIKSRIVHLRKNLDNARLYSPITGRILRLHITPRNGVVLASQPILTIVPSSNVLEVQVQIHPKDIGHIALKQIANVKVSAFDFTRFGSVPGVVRSISPTTLLDPEGQAYYQAIVDPKRLWVGKKRKHAIVAGMTVIAEIKTGSKTVLEYLLSPILKSRAEAFRER
jgi:multidrug efflux pump subunit AcrA (membrane-fusion protein)